VLILLLSLFFFRTLFLGKVLLGADTLFLFPPWKSLAELDFRVTSTLATDTLDSYAVSTFLIEQAKQGNFYFWNPYIASGQAISGLPLLMYPLNWLFLIFPLGPALGYHAALRLFSAGLFTYLFARRIDLGVTGAFMAAIIAMFNGFMIVWLGWNQTHVMAVLPLNLWLLDKLLTRPTLPTALVLSLAILFLFAGGFPPVTVYGLALLAAYALFKLTRTYYDDRDLRSLGWRGLVALSSTSGGILLAAIYFVPILSFVDNGGYIAERANQTQLYRFYHFPVQHLITYLMPGYYGDNVSDPFWGVSNYIESTGYVGVLPLLLIPSALISTRQRQPAWFFTGILLVSTGIIYGFGPLQWLVARLPGFNILINTRLLGINAFALAILAGIGADVLLTQVLSSSNRKLKQAWLATIGGAIVLGLLLLTIEAYWNSIPGQTIDFGVDGNPFGASVVLKKTLYMALLARDTVHLKSAALFSLWFGLGLISIALYLTRIIPAKFFQGILPALLILDLFSFGISFNVAVEPGLVFPQTPSIAALQSEAQDQVSPFRFLALDQVFLGNTSMVYNLPNAGGHSVAHPPRYTRFLRRITPDVWDRTRHGTLLYFSQGTTHLDSNLIDLLNVKYILQDKGSCQVLGHEPDASQVLTNRPIGEIWGDREVGQSFYATQDKLAQICIRVATYRRVNDRDLIFHLKESAAANSDLVTQRVNAAELQDNGWYPFTFPPLANSAYKSFYFSLESPASEPGNAITIWTNSGDDYAAGVLYFEGETGSGDLAFITYTTKTGVESARYTMTGNSDLVIFENEDYLPKAYFASQPIILRDEEAILSTLESEGFDPYQEVILEDPALSLPESAEGHHQMPSVAVELLDYQPNYVRLHLDAPTAGFVILSDLYHPDWTARLDGEATSIYRANYLFRAVQVSPGVHTIEFIFEPDLLNNGGYVSLGTLGIMLVLSLFTISSQMKKL
jgi:hypothetical protein